MRATLSRNIPAKVNKTKLHLPKDIYNAKVKLIKGINFKALLEEYNLVEIRDKDQNIIGSRAPRQPAPVANDLDGDDESLNIDNNDNENKENHKENDINENNRVLVTGRGSQCAICDKNGHSSGNETENAVIDEPKKKNVPHILDRFKSSTESESDEIRSYDDENER